MKKLLCFFGFHKWTASIDDYIEEFGFIPLDGRIASNSVCNRCNQKYNQNKSFTYCQREIEGQSICDKQCEHCKEYYAPLDNQNK
jgi:hypothetical protein